MNYYLVDLENVGIKLFEHFKDIESGDTIILFYNNSIKECNIDFVQWVIDNNINLKSFNIAVGIKNSLDFQLSSYLGFLIAKNDNDTKYHIISNNKGFESVCKFWKNLGYLVDRIGLVKPVDTRAIKRKEALQVDFNDVPKEEIISLEEISEAITFQSDKEDIYKIVNSGLEKCDLHNAFVKYYTSKKGQKIYKQLKKLLEEKGIE